MWDGRSFVLTSPLSPYRILTAYVPPLYRQDTLTEAVKYNDQLKPYINGIADDLNPLRVQVGGGRGACLGGIKCQLECQHCFSMGSFPLTLLNSYKLQCPPLPLFPPSSPQLLFEHIPDEDCDVLDMVRGVEGGRRTGGCARHEGERGQQRMEGWQRQGSLGLRRKGQVGGSLPMCRTCPPS